MVITALRYWKTAKSSALIMDRYLTNSGRGITRILEMVKVMEMDGLANRKMSRIWDGRSGWASLGS